MVYKGTETVEFLPQTRTGENYPVPRLYLATIEGEVNKIDVEKQSTQLVFAIGWIGNGQEFAFIQTDRTMRAVIISATSVFSRKVRKLLEYESSTFIEGLRLPEIVRDLFFELDEGSGFIWLSEQNNLHAIEHYKITGELERIVGPEGIDITRVLRQKTGTREVFTMGHCNTWRPYNSHLFLINMETSAVDRITSETGQHFIDISPTGDFFLDHHASFTQDPVIDLCMSDGQV